MMVAGPGPHREGYRARRRHRYRFMVAGALCALASAAPARADDRLDALIESWFSIEAIVFQRTETSTADGPEHLYRTDSRSVPAGVRSIAADAPGSAYRLSPLTAATLRFPTLSLNCPGAQDASPYRSAGIPAWYPRSLRNGGPLSDPWPVPLQPGPASEIPGGAATPAAVNGGPDASGQVVNETGDQLLNGLPYDACTPAGPEFDGPNGTGPDIDGPTDRGPAIDTADASGSRFQAGHLCPPVSFDIPVAPSQSRPLCGPPAGRPPPAIEPTLEPHPLLDWLNAARRFETRLRADSYRTATRGTILRREANRIRNAPQLRLLWHGRWTQPVPPRSTPEPLLIQAGRRNDGVHELEGTVDITLGRYLHFHAHLWWASPRKALNAEGAPPSSIPNGTESGSHPQSPEGAEYMVLRESRVMRSGTLHYLDHPVLGVLVRADPLTAPGWLADASAAFESEQGGD